MIIVGPSSTWIPNDGNMFMTHGCGNILVTLGYENIPYHVRVPFGNGLLAIS